MSTHGSGTRARANGQQPPAASSTPTKESPAAKVKRIERDYVRLREWLEHGPGAQLTGDAMREHYGRLSRLGSDLDQARRDRVDAEHLRQAGVRALRTAWTNARGFRAQADIFQRALYQAHQRGNTRPIDAEMERFQQHYAGVTPLRGAQLRSLSPFQRAIHDWLTKPKQSDALNALIRARQIAFSAPPPRIATRASSSRAKNVS